MGGVGSLLQISKDLGLLVASAAGFCAALLFSLTWNIAHVAYRFIISKVYSLLYAFIWSPCFIIASNTLQLVFLPINIPLRILVGTTMQRIIVQANSWTNGYVLTTISQYALVLIVFGVTLGAICGACLGFIHSVTRVPKVVVDIPILFWKRIPAVLRYTRNLLLPKAASELKTYVPEDIRIPTPSPSIPPSEILEPLFTDMPQTLNSKFGKTMWQRHSTSSKESVLERASKLPSDFFQQKSTLSDLRSEHPQYYYQSPAQSPRNVTQDDSSHSSTNIWDRYDELPTTLRTEGGMSTLYSRRPFTFPEKGEREQLNRLRRGE
ncbi:hypothetical protein HG536_0C02890 [Torulaspora globosa]|uniref:Uncharacterized protein n=1 Tax=Torulaspora globosa TaxID=48254 RepID=A0A7G3ZF34_9SACH|nr:uncharacterized protein HG536_0C02890 [Torulaspora globosa]QLL32120.1 hypothetical protein HG536_0C02890 [Torulaspora globosa]